MDLIMQYKEFKQLRMIYDSIQHASYYQTNEEEMISLLTCVLEDYKEYFLSKYVGSKCRPLRYTPQGIEFEEVRTIIDIRMDGRRLSYTLNKHPNNGINSYHVLNVSII